MRIAALSFAHARAETYVRLLRDMPGVDLVTADPGAPPDDPARGRAAADRLGVSYVDSWDDVFESRPAAVVVTSEVGRRRELVERAAGVAASVLCEQPPATTEADLQAMVDACAAGGVRLTLASPACFSPAFAAVRRGIADGVVGTLTTIHGSYHTGPATRSDAGVLAANAPFLLDLVDTVLDGPIGKALADKLPEKGLVHLAYFDLGFRNITDSKRAIKTAEDIAGLKIRVIQSPISSPVSRTPLRSTCGSGVFCSASDTWNSGGRERSRPRWSSSTSFSKGRSWCA